MRAIHSFNNQYDYIPIFFMFVIQWEFGLVSA